MTTCAPDAAVVGDVHQVVELGAFADGGDAQSGAVHAGVGADLHVVADHHAAHLREFFVGSAGQDESETVGSDDAARVQDHVIPEGHFVIQGDARMQHAVPADADIVADDGAGSNGGAFANMYSGAHAHQGSDGSAFADDGAGAQNGGGMNTRRWLARRMQLRYSASHRGPRVARADDGAASCR